MAGITRYGDIAGQMPNVTGETYWVAPSASYTVYGKSCGASDGNSGTDPRKALLTLGAAVAKCTASVGDTIVLLPGSHAWTGATALSVAGITVTGLSSNASNVEGLRGARGGRKNRTAVTATGGHVLTVSAADVEISFLHFVPAAGYAGIAPTAAGDRVFIHDCTFAETTATNTATMGIDLYWTGTAATLDDVVVRNCTFVNADANGPAIHVGATTIDLTIENCSFRNTGDTAWDDAIEIIPASLGTVIRDCDFLERASGTVITDCIDNTGATVDGSTTVLRCMFPVGSNSLTNANVADNQVAENYLMAASASQGGTLVLST
jgi:hypothetical protein